MSSRPLGRVLTAEQAGLYRDATGALEAARADADRIRAEAEAQADAARHAVLEAATAEATLARARILAETSATAQHALLVLQRDIADAVAAGVATVIGELGRAESVALAARRAIADLASRHGITVRVHPSHVAEVRAALAGWGEGADVAADAALELDGCVVETASGFVRAGLSEQLEILRAALRDAAKLLIPVPHA